MSIIEKLFRIQQKAVSPKNKENSFAGYKYRNVEGILHDMKPHFKAEQVYCKLSDEVVEVNGQAYVKATAILYDCESGENIAATGWAREAESKKGNDSSQCTGSASTYARKYALCGLLGLDDSKAKAVSDPDVQTPMEHDADNGEVRKKSNNSGGILGGISDGSSIILTAAFKPTPSIYKSQKTVNNKHEDIELEIKGRHDPIIAPRAVVVVEAMSALVIADALLMNCSSKLDNVKKIYEV